jgi:hypothetical protein
MFPGRTQEILKLSLSDTTFRDLCEDLSEAQASLNRLAPLPGHVERPEVAEYRTIIAELEDEIRAYVASESTRHS